MARKQFTVNTEPHVAEIGDIELLFRPEVNGGEFLDKILDMQEHLAPLAALATRMQADPESLSPDDVEKLRGATRALSAFVGNYLIEESKPVFAEAALPDRVLVELLAWLKEVYSGGRPTGSATGSQQRSPKAGTRSTGNSRSKASTSKR